MRPDLAAQVRNIICLGSPHEGTRAAPGLAGRLPPRLLPEVHALSVGSSSLIALPGLETLAPESRRLYITAGWDMLVYPRENACESSGRHEPFEALGHCGLLTDRRVRDLVLKQQGKAMADFQAIMRRMFQGEAAFRLRTWQMRTLEGLKDQQAESSRMLEDQILHACLSLLPVSAVSMTTDLEFLLTRNLNGHTCSKSTYLPRASVCAVDYL